ncbi:MAG: hydroxylamine reductase [Alphaproteobacteria bacterium]|uniref:Hydroxylamine reductase n=1 Tax=Candidatus Nitrobium versatile TaxID=2884831 RepID=A0A953J2F6_9BACT|nr:hydroxylamine reductase [Candidatus Nitrobium versatile]
MFCYQCEKAANGTGCTTTGACGKTPEVSDLQDLLVYSLQGLSVVALEGRKAGITDREVDEYTVDALFSTATNVNFNPDFFVSCIKRCAELKDGLIQKLRAASLKTAFAEGPANFLPEKSREGMLKQAQNLGLFSSDGVLPWQGQVHRPGNPDSLDPDVLSLRSTTLFGLKGVAAYTGHARTLGRTDDAIYSFFHEMLASMTRKDLSLDAWVGLALKCGEINIRAMELLDKGNTGTYGDPVFTTVPLGRKKGKAILVSGHDLKELEEILKQSEGKGIYVYTHGEMLPTHGYPGLKKYAHFYGHYGTAWHNQNKEFEQFPGAIVLSTNCFQKPLDSYKDKVFTTGVVGSSGIQYITKNDFAPVIKKALSLPGFLKDEDLGSVLTGAARNAILSAADTVIEAVKNKSIRHFFLVAGCDSGTKGRHYYSDFVEKVPKDCVVLTLACGKFRFFDKKLGDIGGIPRLLDVGQCNDAYSSIQIAVALAKAFSVGVNDLPLSMVLSWNEQKAVAVLLSLFHLGIQGIRIGPSLPAFISPGVLGVLIKNFNVMAITTPDADLKAILGPAA